MVFRLLLKLFNVLNKGVSSAYVRTANNVLYIIEDHLVKTLYINLTRG